MAHCSFIRRLRPPRHDDGYEPCDFEEARGVRWYWLEGSYPPAQGRRRYWICRYAAGGFVTDCPYPARICRPKMEIEE